MMIRPSLAILIFMKRSRANYMGMIYTQKSHLLIRIYRRIQIKCNYLVPYKRKAKDYTLYKIIVHHILFLMYRRACFHFRHDYRLRYN